MTAELRDISDAEPNDELVKMLERWLEDARAGNLRSIVASLEWRYGGNITTGWSLSWRTNKVTMLGALSIAQYELATKECLSRGDTVISAALYGE